MGRERLIPLLVAAVIAVGAVVLFSSSGADEEPEQAASTATATPADEEAEPASTPTPSPTATPRPPLLTAENTRTLRFEEGDRIRFRVRADGPEEVHVHGYDIERPIPAGETVTLSFEADLVGIFEVELHGSGAPLGELRVEPS